MTYPFHLTDLSGRTTMKGTFSNEAGNVNTLSLLVAAIIIVPSLIKASHNGYKSEASDGIVDPILMITMCGLKMAHSRRAFKSVSTSKQC